MITIEQIKAARALLRMSQEKLAKAAGLSRQAVAALETRAVLNPDSLGVTEVVKALEKSGVRFTETGVEIRKKKT